MKTFFSGKAIAALCIGASLFFTACNKNDDNNDNPATTYNVSGNGSGTQVSPSVTTTATSTLTGTYNKNTKAFQYNVSWTGLAATASAVHFYGPADVGANATGAAQFDGVITTPGINGSASGSTTLTAAQETDLLNGKWYYTVTNATYLAGEIRGQITATAQ